MSDLRPEFSPTSRIKTAKPFGFTFITTGGIKNAAVQAGSPSLDAFLLFWKRLTDWKRWWAVKFVSALWKFERDKA
jgi:hypothetical protein